MAKVTILHPGYSAADFGGRSCSTITLVQNQGLNLVADPGTAADQQVIVDALKKYDLKPEYIDVVFVTHAHTDHYRNAGMFKNAKVLDYWGIWDKDKSYEYKPDLYQDIKMIETPGHSYDSMSLLVETDDGMVAICGDVFWKKDEPKHDPYASDLEELKESRQKVLKTADFVIPGHGEKFAVER